VVGFRWDVAEIWNSKVQETQKFRQVWIARSVILYVLCGGLYCLRYGLVVVLKEVCARPYIFQRIQLHRNSNLIIA
jgi:hypothetical protein